jgi:Fe-S oxidoreductase
MGCTYRNKLTALGGEITKLLKKLDVSFSLLEEECCGYPLALIGYSDEAAKLAKRNIERLEKKSLIVTPCPACYRAFKEFCPELAKSKRSLNVMHITQFYSGLIDRKILNPSDLRPVRIKVMYHDPCELGRHSNIYEEPRRVLNLIPDLDIYDPRYSRNLSACCGGGGLVSAYFPTLATMAAARKILEEDQAPADLQAIVTECPQCISNLQQAWIEGDNPDIKLYNLAKLLNMALGN